MAWIFGDGFDFYSSISDLSLFWDGVSPNFTLSTSGRFTGSRCIGNVPGATIDLIKSSSTNDATHHIVVAFIQTSMITGSTIGRYIQFLDGTNSQVCLCFRSDGVILLTSGSPTGTVLATYTNAFAQNVWVGFEFEINFHPSSGAFHVRKNGSSSDNYVQTSINTAPSGNAWANKIQICLYGNLGSSNTHLLDDFAWFSTTGSAPNTWVGDIKAVQLMPNADTAQKQFSTFPASYKISPSGGINGSWTISANSLYSGQIVNNSQSGTLVSLSWTSYSAFTGHYKLALYDNLGTGSGPGNLLAVTAEQTNAPGGSALVTVPVITPVAVSSGSGYFGVILADASITVLQVYTGGYIGQSVSASYASGPPATFGGSSFNVANAPQISMNVAPANNAMVSNAQTDGDTTYVYSSTVGANDLYNINTISFPILSVVGVQTRGVVRKSDAGGRSAQIQAKSGTTTFTTPTLLLATSYQTSWRFDATDPNTGFAWTNTTINALQIGPVVQS